MNYGIAENEIVTRLNTHFTDNGLSEKFIAKEMPETEEEAKDFERLFPKARVAVEHIKSDFQPSSSLTGCRQEETVTFRLLFEHKKMRGEGGLHSMMAEVKKSLLGFRLSNTDELIISGYGRQQYEAGVWLPFLDFECKTINVQAFMPSVPGEEILGGPLQPLVMPNDQFLQQFDTGFL